MLLRFTIDNVGDHFVFETQCIILVHALPTAALSTKITAAFIHQIFVVKECENMYEKSAVSIIWSRS